MSLAKDPATNYRHTPFPQQVVVEVTAACNQRCVFCGRTYMDRPKKTMGRAMFEKIVTEIAQQSPYTELWPTFMGEAMLLGDKLFDMVRFAKEAGCKKITLNTNGTRLNAKTIPRLLEGGIDRFIVSCDAHTPETHARVRPAAYPPGSDGLTGIYRGIQRLLRAMRDQQRTTPIIELQFSIFDENQHEAEEFKNYWLQEGVIVKVRPKLFWSGEVKGGDHRVGFESRVPCLWSMETMGIHWNGNIVMCVVDCDGKYVAGNVEWHTLKETWDGPLKWIRELHMRRRFSELPEVCRKCPDWLVKKAHAYFPNDTVQREYEEYVRKGRVFMERHFWDEHQNGVKTN